LSSALDVFDPYPSSSYLSSSSSQITLSFEWYSLAHFISRFSCEQLLGISDGFEKDSLHSNFFISNEKVQEQKATKKRRDSALKPIIQNDDNLSAIDQTRRLLRSQYHLIFLFVCLFICLNVFNSTFNNISAISWQSVLLMKETVVPG
jgi:hypothetical protein